MVTNIIKPMANKKIVKKEKQSQSPQIIKVDLGCGKNKRQDNGPWIGVDSIDFEGVDLVLNIGKAKWPWKGNSVEEAHASHFVEHLEPEERIHFVNELHRVLKPGGKCTIIVPHWASQRAYGDLTHRWPPVSEFWFYYLDKGWRAVNAPHNLDYTCDFNVTWGYSLRNDLTVRNEEFQRNAILNYKEACADTIATFTKKDQI